MIRFGNVMPRMGYGVHSNGVSDIIKSATHCVLPHEVIMPRLTQDGNNTVLRCMPLLVAY